MESFEDLGLTPELLDALTAEGIERPTPLQETAIPVVRRGHNLVLAAGPGSGLLAAWAVPLLDRVAPEGSKPLVLGLTATAEAAGRLAESLGRLAAATGHSVAALGGAWALPERAHVLLGTPADVLRAARETRVSLAEVRAVVVDQAQQIEQIDGIEAIESVIEFLPAEAQRVLSALPVGEAVAGLVERHMRRAVTVPAGDVAAGAVKRGTVRFRIVTDPREEGALGVVSELLTREDARHVLVYCRNEDRAADVGDYLTLHGFTAGAPGDPATPVWLGLDALEARAAIESREGVRVVSCDVPPDPDTLDRRHALSAEGVVVVLAREVAHLRDLARRTGYGVVPFPPPATPLDPGAEVRDTLERALEEEDAAAYLPLIAPLFERFDPAEVAAAAVALLRARPRGPAAGHAPADAPSLPARAPAWAKLFLSVGERDGLRTSDVLGAITGEARVPGDAVGRIDIKESHCLVEVHDDVARAVIDALNGKTIRGRAVRADFDRPKRKVPAGRRPGPRG